MDQTIENQPAPELTIVAKPLSTEIIPCLDNGLPCLALIIILDRVEEGKRSIIAAQASKTQDFNPTDFMRAKLMVEESIRRQEDITVIGQFDDMGIFCINRLKIRFMDMSF